MAKSFLADQIVDDICEDLRHLDKEEYQATVSSIIGQLEVLLAQETDDDE